MRRAKLALGITAVFLAGCGHVISAKHAVAPAAVFPSADATSPNPDAAATPTPTPTPTPQEIISTAVAKAPAGLTRCGSNMLRIGYGDQVTPETGEHSVMYSLSNTSRRSCWMRGYAAVSLLDSSSKALPFHYTQEHSQYMTSAVPGTVVVPPTASAYFLVAKYRCDLGTATDAVRIAVIPPTGNGKVFAATDLSTSSGVYTLSYCTGGPHDLGQTVAVSPVEASQLDAYPGR